MRAALLALVLTLLVTAPAAAQDQRLEAAREEAGALPTPIGQLDTPAGRLQLERAELLAARHDQPIRFRLKLGRDVERGTLRIALPRRWRDVPSSGLRPSTPPRGRRVGPAQDAVELVLDGAAAGDELTAELRDRGIPAGTYELPVSLDGRPVGRLELILYAPVREPDERPWSDVRALNFSDSPFHQSETFVTVAPGDPDRLIAGANHGTMGFSAWISTDAGETWVERPMPAAAPRISGATTLDPCCDPTSAADAEGNLWYGGLDHLPDSHIVVARVPAGSDDFVRTVALPSLSAAAQQDKPMMTIDNSPTSPTYGRLYVVWSSPSGGGHRIVTSFCDTRPGGVSNPAACDLAGNWSPVTAVSGPGSRTYADVAVGPDGRVFVTWWNFSSANRIEGSVCSAGCGSSANWSTPAGIAALDATGSRPVPNDCPILAQPGGRAAPAPNVEVSRTDGHVYVAWSDLRAGSGSTRCSPEAPPLATHLSFDPYVKSAAGALPGLAIPATRLLTDAEGAAGADDWFPWLAVDQSSGLAHAAFYSTRDDPSRRTSHFYARSVGDDGSLGGLVRASDAASDYSGAVCCTFGNDYGDYAGLSVVDGLAFAAWADKSTASGEGLAEQLALPPPGAVPVLQPGAAEVEDPAPGGDGDGVPEPGETLEVAVPVVNVGAADATAATGTLTSPDAVDTADYGDVAVGDTAEAPPYRIALPAELPCGATVPLRLRVAHAGAGLGLERYAVRTGGEIATVHSADVPRNIPDASPVRVSSAIAMPDAGTIGDVDVGVSIEHTFVGELSLTLRHPDGTEVLLTHRVGDPTNSDDHFLGTIFDDEAAGALFATGAPFAGRLRPDDPLAALDGKPWEGTWTLIVDDATAKDGGRVTAWSLQRRTCGEPIPDAPQDGVANPDLDPQPPVSGPAVVEPPVVDPPVADPPPRPFVRLARSGARVRVRRGRVRVRLRGCARCRGRLTLTTRVNRRRVRIARARFTITSRGTATATVRLSKRGRALLRRRGRLRIAARLTVTAADARSASGAGRLTLVR